MVTFDFPVAKVDRSFCLKIIIRWQNEKCC